MGIKLKDLKFGELNTIKRNGDNPSGDRRRTTTATAIRFATEKAFEINTLKSVKKFTGFVVGVRRISRPISEYKDTIVTFQETDSTEGSMTEVANYLYKVYIPELEPLPAPKSYQDPVIGLYADVSLAMGPAGLGGHTIAPGDLVEVTYTNVTNLSGPKITRVVSPPVAGGMSIGAPTSSRSVFSSRVPITRLPTNLGTALLFGDSQSHGGSTLGGYLPKELEKKGIKLIVEAKYGKGIISSKKHWDIENPNGLAQRALATAGARTVIVELGGNDSYWVGNASSASKHDKYLETIQKWISVILSYHVTEIIWLGPSKATKIGSDGVPYDNLRQNVRDWQRETLEYMTQVTWYDTVPYTKDLPMKDDGVHFPASSYKEWANRLVQPGAPLGALEYSSNTGSTV